MTLEDIESLSPDIIRDIHQRMIEWKYPFVKKNSQSTDRPAKYQNKTELYQTRAWKEGNRSRRIINLLDMWNPEHAEEANRITGVQVKKGLMFGSTR